MPRLIIRPGAIGDCLLALPAIEFLQTGQTELWLPSALCSLLETGPARVRSIAATGLDRFGLGDGFVPAGLAEALQSFDTVVSWYGENRPVFRAAAEKLNPNWRFLRALPPSDCLLHAADYFLSQVGGTLPAPPPQSLPFLSPPICHGAIAIHPFSGSPAKNWPLEFYLELASRLGGLAEVVMLAGPEEELPGARRFADLRSLASWLRGAALYVGNDSGPTHLAAAAGIPVIALFGPTNPAIWAPRGPNVTVLRREPLMELTVDEVLAKCRCRLTCISPDTSTGTTVRE